MSARLLQQGQGRRQGGDKSCTAISDLAPPVQAAFAAKQFFVQTMFVYNPPMPRLEIINPNNLVKWRVGRGVMGHVAGVRRGLKSLGVHIDTVGLGSGGNDSPSWPQNFQHLAT